MYRFVSSIIVAISICTVTATIPAFSAPATPASSATGPQMVQRLSVAPPVSAKLATPLELAIRVSSPDLLQELYFTQPGEESHPLTITRRAGSMIYATVTLTVLGPVTFRITALFSDGGISITNASTTVLLPDAPPATLVGDANFQQVRLGLGEGENLYVLHPQAVYATAPDSKIDVKRFARYRVIANRDSPAVEVTPDGSIRSLRPGKAVVEVRFEGVVDHVQVEVEGAD